MCKGPQQNYGQMGKGGKILVEPLFNYNIDFLFKNVQVPLSVLLLVLSVQEREGEYVLL